MARMEGGGTRPPVPDSKGELVRQTGQGRKALSPQAVGRGRWCLQENLKPETVSLKRTGCFIHRYFASSTSQVGELEHREMCSFLKKTHFSFTRDCFLKQEYLEKREKLPIKKWMCGLLKALEH